MGEKITYKELNSAYIKSRLLWKSMYRKYYEIGKENQFSSKYNIRILTEEFKVLWPYIKYSYWDNISYSDKNREMFLGNIDRIRIDFPAIRNKINQLHFKQVFTHKTIH